MATSGSVFSATLHSITTTKLTELSKKRQDFENQKLSVLEKIQSSTNPLEKLTWLALGVKFCFGVKTDKSGKVINGASTNQQLELQLTNLDRFLEQARHDPSVSAKLLQEWYDSLMKHFDVQTAKYQYATIYGELVTEWLSAEKKAAVTLNANDDMSDGFEEISTSGQKMDSRMQWEQNVFEPFHVDETALKQYLDNTFGADGKSKAAAKAMAALRENVHNFENNLTHPHQFSTAALQWTIDGLLQSDLLGDEKRAALKDFRGNNVILSEIADVLNMRLGALSSWTWGEHVSIEQRRKVTGSYSIYMDEDLLQAIFLHFIGVKWSVFFRNAFKQFSNTEGAWLPLANDIPQADMATLQHFMPWTKTKGSLQHKRQKLQRKHFEFAQLLTNEHQQLVGDEGAEEAEYNTMPAQAPPAQAPASMFAPAQQQMQQAPRHRTLQTARRSTGGAAPRMQLASQPARAPHGSLFGSANNAGGAYLAQDEDDDGDDDDDEGDFDNTKDPMAAKQTLLHYLASDIIINKHVHGGISVFHTVFDSWMPSIPHNVVRIVLQYLGVSEKFLSFFTTFLQAPLKFVDESNSEPRLRQRGSPGAHVLSEVFGEALLFCLDYAINQATNGQAIKRIHDDLWFWSASHETVRTAWDTIGRFSEVMGIRLNSSKSGSACISRDEASRANSTDNDNLPRGDIRWGFLRLDSASGRFVIDLDMVDMHISDLQKQLSGKKSIFSWIQAWNTFASTFFSTNFGKPANCYGRAHVDMILSSLRRVQENVFVDGHGSVVAYLKAELKSRFGLDDIPDGFLFFPAELGGLDLVNPFVGPLQIREALLQDPSARMKDFDETEEESHSALLAAFKRGELGNRPSPPKRWHAESMQINHDQFLSIQGYTKYREDVKYKFHPNLADIFEQLMSRPEEESVSASQPVLNALAALSSSGMNNLKGITSNWHAMNPYWKWVAVMYGPDMIEKFGGLNVVDPGLLPIGMVSLFKSGRVSWQ